MSIWNAEINEWISDDESGWVEEYIYTHMRIAKASGELQPWNLIFLQRGWKAQVSLEEHSLNGRNKTIQVFGAPSEFYLRSVRQSLKDPPNKTGDPSCFGICWRSNSIVSFACAQIQIKYWVVLNVIEPNWKIFNDLDIQQTTLTKQYFQLVLSMQTNLFSKNYKRSILIKEFLNSVPDYNETNQSTK